MKIFFTTIISVILINITIAQKNDLSNYNINKSIPYKIIGGIPIDGNLEIYIYDNGNMQVNRFIYGIWKNQWYGTCSKSFIFQAGGIVYSGMGCYFSGANVLLETICNNSIDSKTNELILEKGNTIRISQHTYYPDNSSEIYYTWKITNISGNNMNDLRFYTGGDTYLYLSDEGAGFWDIENNSVGVRKTCGNKLLAMYIKTITTPHAFESQHYQNVYYHVVDGSLKNIIDTNEIIDNGLAMEFRKNCLQADSSWIIKTVEKFTDSIIPDLMVISPATQNIVPGDSVYLQFIVRNKTALPLTVFLETKINKSNWNVCLVSPSSTFDILPYESKEVIIKVNCPFGWLIHDSAMVTLKATDYCSTASGHCFVVTDNASVNVEYYQEIIPIKYIYITSLKLLELEFSFPIESAVIEIINLEGAVVIRKHIINCTQFQLNLNKITTGIYFIKIKIKNQVFTRKIMVC